MTNFLFGTQKTPSRSVKAAATNPRIQTSANGVARSFGYGQARISGNLLWYGNFYAEPTYSSVASGGGKGGGGSSGGAVQNGWNYYASAIFGLCEGPVTGVLQGWENKSAISLAQGTPLKTSPTTTDVAGETFSLFDGDYKQLPWGWLATVNPAVAQNLRGIAYEAAYNLNLGSSPELPNMTFETRFAITGAIAETATVPAGGGNVTAQYFDPDYGVVQHAVVPASSPYQVQPDLGNIIEASGIAMSIGNGGDVWIVSNSFGVVWDDGCTGSRVAGAALTKVTNPTASGEYAVGLVGSTYQVTFAAADAGQPVVIVNAAVSPGVYYTTETTGTLSTGSAIVAGLGTMAGIGVGSRVLAAGTLPPFTFVQSLSGGAATGSTSPGSAVVSGVTGTFSATAGTPVADSAGAFPAGTTYLSGTAAGLTLSASSGLTVSGAAITITTEVNDQSNVSLNGNEITGLSAADAAQLAPGSTVEGANTGFVGTVASISTSGPPYTATLTFSSGLVAPEVFTVWTQITGNLSAGSAVVTSPSSLVGVTTSALSVEDSYGAIPGGTTISSVSTGSVTLSHTAGSSVGSDVLTFSEELTLSTEATAGGAGVALTFIGAPLTQVLPSPSEGEFSIAVTSPASFGTYVFAAADADRTVLILDSADANPADVLVDFLTNPYYGLTQFPADRIGNLSTYRAYCQAAGLVVSPVVSTQTAATSFLQDLMSATNSEIVWSGGLLTVVPYGDAAITANGATYTPPTQPLYSLDDDDFLDNEGTNPNSVSAASSPDPVTITRLDIADQENDIKIEFLDRGNAYNPTIVEAKDDAAISLFGVKSNGSKQLHLFCTFAAALTSAQLMLGRQQVLRTFSLTLGREYILLDPMDIIAITDANAGLEEQWVRITEITENDDRTLSITAEEYLEGTGAAPVYPHQRPGGFVPSYNAPAPAALAPIFFDAPVQIGNVLGMETILCTNGTGSGWSGCDIWISSDDVSFKYAGTLLGGTAMGTLTASFGALAVSTTLSAAQASTDTTIGLSSGTNFFSGAAVLIDQEYEKIGTLSGSSGTAVARRLDGTTAQAHQNGATVTLVADDTNTLAVDLTESLGSLVGGAQSDADNYNTLALVGGELVAFSAATLTAQYKYNLGTYIRRGVYGTTIASYVSGTAFARLREGSYFTLGYDAADIGRTIYVKLLSFNQYGGGKMTLDEAISYPHTIAAPPVAVGGTVAGLVSTSDIAANAATGQTTVTSQAGGAVASGASTSILSAAYTSTGQTLQVSGSVGLNETGGSVTCLVSISRDGSIVYSPAPVLVPATVSAANTTITVPFNFTDTPAAGAHTYTIKAEANGIDMNWTSAELVVTEIKR